MLLKVSFLSSVLLVVIGLLSACNYEIVKTATQAPNASSNLQKTTSFNMVYEQVFRPQCVACHGNAGGVRLDTYASAIQSLEKIRISTLVLGRMPKAPYGPLKEEQRNLLAKWIEQGGPEFVESEPPPVTEPPPLVANFESIKASIFETKCLSCHAQGKSVERIPLETREQILNSPLELVIPGVPEESGLILSVRREEPHKVMPPLVDKTGQPTGFSRLSEEEILVLEEWVRLGAP